VLACVRGRLRVWSEPARQADTVVLLEGEEACWVLAPAGALDQVLDAVLHNALRFTPGGHVTVSVTPTAGRVTLEVVDDGPGMTPQQCAAATQRFWRGPDQQNVPGSGLGLAIARTLVERCGGRLTLGPVQPHGLRVCAELPLLEAQSTPGLADR